MKNEENEEKGAVDYLRRQQIKARPTKPRSKIDDVSFSAVQWAGLTSDGSLGYGALVEALAPGEWDAERANAVVAAIRRRIERVRAGDPTDLEADLCAQLSWLSSLIAYCVRQGTAESINAQAADVWLRLALKTQTAYARTAVALANVAASKPRAVGDT